MKAILRTRIILAATVLTAAATAGVAALLVYSQHCQFTAGMMAFHDYGIYFNMLWNTAHGRWFTYLTDQSYLGTHLSFSLALLAPLFRLWDNPLLLTAIQWGSLAAGIALIWRGLILSRLSPFTTAAVLFLFVAYPFTQSAMLCEFHGVHLYYILLPWLYLHLAFRKAGVWLPLILLAGLREDAAFVAIPMLLYFALADRWKAGFFWSLAAAAYGVFALTILFPWINGVSISDYRDLDSGTIVSSLRSQLSKRFLPLFRLFLPAIPLFILRRRNWIPIVVFPSVFLVLLVFSHRQTHYGIRDHYSVGVFTCLLLGMIEALRRRKEDPAPSPARQPWRLAAFLVIITVASHFVWGVLPWGVAHPKPVLKKPSAYIPSVLRVARHIPPEGTLLTDSHIAGYLANRASIITFKSIKTHPRTPDHILFDAVSLKRYHKPGYNPLLLDRAMGVIAFEPPFVVMRRGADPSRNEEVLAAITNSCARARGAPP